MSKFFNYSIHGLRGFSALGIVLFHIYEGALKGDFLPNIFSDYFTVGIISLKICVDLFFIVSGYLIVSTLYRCVNLREFILGRALRIYPAFLPLITIIFIAGPFIGYDYFENVTAWEWPFLFVSNVLFLPGIFPLEPALIVAWTLSYEMMFYAICSLFFIATTVNKTRKKKIYIIFLVFLSLILCILFPKALFFAGGALVFFIRDKEHLKIIQSKFLNISVLLFFLFFNYLCSLLGLWRLEDSIAFYLVTIVNALLCLLIFTTVSCQTGIFADILRLRAFQFLGTISYSLYIWHTPIMFVTKRVSQGIFLNKDFAFLTFFISSLFLSLFISWLSYIILEKELRQRLSKKFKIVFQNK